MLPHFARKPGVLGVSETYQYVVGDYTFHLIVDDGSIELRDGRAENPAVTLTTDEETLAEIAGRNTTTSSAAATGALTVTGDREASKRLGRIFSRSQMFEQAGAAGSSAKK